MDLSQARDCSSAAHGHMDNYWAMVPDVHVVVSVQQSWFANRQTDKHAHTHKWNANITATAWDVVVDQFNRFQSFLHLWDKLDVWNKLQQFGASRNSPGCVFLLNVRRQKSLFFFSYYWLYVQPFLLLSIFICLSTFSVSVLLTGPLNAFRRPHLS